ncbi:MAG: cell envelope integrity protein CreD, partial [Muribaculaceae bacterium]|nr:cell envelope integrity protein CreD [Muribaculaceae bacterium]
MSYGRKIFLLGLQSGILMFAALIIWIISTSRDSLNSSVAAKIAQEWGKEVSISGPVILADSDSVGGLRPETFVCDARVETKSLHRNIYEAEVFSAGVTMSGAFRLDSLTASCDTVLIRLDVPSDQISRLSPLSLGGKSIGWRKTKNHLFAEVAIAGLPQNVDFLADFDIRGSESLYIDQIGDKSTITIDGQAPNPSFRGSSLPEDRNVRGRTFAARWYSDTAPATGVAHTDGNGFVGTDFLVGVDRYQKVDRAMKYAFFIILLTYLSVLATEMIMRREIPLLNYFLRGAALVIFYSL